VRAAAEQIDFHQVDRAAQNFNLFFQVQIPALFTGRLVGKAEDLDHRYEAFSFIAEPRADFDFELCPLVVRHFEDQGLRPRRQGHAAPIVPATFDAGTKHSRIGFHVPRGAFHPYPFINLSKVGLRQSRL
jgi:hypothetical protein